MDFKLEPYHYNISSGELILDIQNVKMILNKESITQSDYENNGKYSIVTIKRKFGTWNKALNESGLDINKQLNISDEELFNNIEKVWNILSRQPRRDEFKQPLSKYSTSPYVKRFGGWRKALERFVEYMDNDSKDELADQITETGDLFKNDFIKHNTKREISDRLRFRILMRDGFTCKSCGRSPIKDRDIELHVDHITPWSRGGETVPDNLETKCQKCNLGKGNAFNK